MLRSHSVLYSWLRIRLWEIKGLAPHNPFPQYMDPKNPDWVLTQELIRSIRDESNARGAQFLLVILPQRNYLNGMYDPVIYDSIIEFAKSENIAAINLLPLMKSYRWTEVFYLEDGHFTPFGARVTAQIIYQTIQTMDYHDKNPF
ncbi:hypothetical protein AMJ86_05825 [bacterium SM23_57]|nr:MAG: hypothetical protein AMJ86_05825 [bacterium SM23_57]